MRGVSSQTLDSYFLFSELYSSFKVFTNGSTTIYAVTVLSHLVSPLLCDLGCEVLYLITSYDALERRDRAASASGETLVARVGEKTTEREWTY